MGANVVSALPPADGVSECKRSVFMAARSVLVTAAAIVAVEASISTLILVFVAV